jgi:hypothetical protein
MPKVLALAIDRAIAESISLRFMRDYWLAPLEEPLFEDPLPLEDPLLDEPPPPAF